ncbi:MAG: 2-hydroxyacyl-CoA dehydratase family protein [Deltaproteobacteria bacterium]|jgi:bcr-type benzoyl-CoA reductase subunit C|nr:2-hydroxyacyl-CoA dehydratase family protein [Deltaproteobacteria bacterium]
MSGIEAKLQRFAAIADDLEGQLKKYTDQGVKVIGCMPVYTPQELVHAAGMLPLSIWGSEKYELIEAKKYFPAYISSLAQSCLELGLRGRLDRLAGVIIPVLSDALKCLSQNWKAGVPQVRHIQLVHPQNRRIEPGIVFLSKQYKKIAGVLEDIAGAPITPAGLKKAIHVFNEHRAVMREFTAVAADYPHLISPLARNAVIKSGGLMPRAEHARMVRELMAECRAEPKEPWKGRKVVLTGMLADSPSMLRILTDYKLAVAGDDVGQESRQFRTDVPDDPDPYRALALQWANIEGCSVAFDPERKRGRMVADLAARTGASGVIYLLTKFCDPEEFDYPIMKKEFDRAGLPSVLIEIDQQMRNYAQPRTAVQTFADMLG